MTAEQIHEWLVASGGLENHEDRPRPLGTEERLAAVRRNELRRIWNLMTGAGWETYSPESDPEVHRWRQELWERQERESGTAVGPDPELISYRIVAQRTDPAHPGAAVVTNYAYGRSVEDAVAKARKVLEKPDGLYGDRGMYRVVQVTEESLSSEVRQQEDACRRFLTTILEAAVTAVGDREPGRPSPDLSGVLDDFFTRAIAFPGQLGFLGEGEDVVQLRPSQSTFGFTEGADGNTGLHTSDPGWALSQLLLAHLTHHGLDLVEAAVRTGDRPAPPDEPMGVGRPSAHDAKEKEGGEASAELVERVLDVCGQHYAAVTGTSSDQWDQESARELVDIALRTVRLAERETYPQALEEYLHERRARLERLRRRYGPGGMFAGELVLIDLPGCFVLCERIDEAPLWLEGVWAEQGQEETALERLHDSWLYETGEKDGR
ncbi:hypothetical protein [Streptomyces sp. NPDC001978]|uniref:hypothetical protein n=1 Tax=Streptomyces sp. NPDC001978 TaxID=3364627 RepID=UPI00367C0859